MSGQTQIKEGSSVLTKTLSRTSAWALSFGCIVGWGAFVMPGTTFLPIAGPVGTAVGMAAGALMIAVIAVNYHYMMKAFPDAGGTFTYSYRTFGGDHGFLSAWFMILAYMSILWANLTAISLIGRTVFGDLFKTGYLYSIADYDIYIGEIVLEITVLVIFGTVCLLSKRLAERLQILFASALFIGIVLCFILCLGQENGGNAMFSPAFRPDNNAFSQVMGVVALAPWAFVGFESVSNSAEEFRFPVKKTLAVMLLAVAAGFISYTLLGFVAASAQPEGYADWVEYMADLDSLSGTDGMPVFYVMRHTGGNAGMAILGTALICAILTGVIGSITASSRLLYSMAHQRIMPVKFGIPGKCGSPKNAIIFITLISCVIPFLGRTAIGWVVDVITVGTTIAYGYTSAAAFKCAKESGNKRIMFTGIAGVVLSALIGLLLLIPDLLAENALSAESYLLLAFWGILGIVFFRFVFMRDNGRRFGSSTVVWLALLFLIFFTSLMWVRQETNAKTEEVVGEVVEYYTEEMDSYGIERDDVRESAEQSYLEERMENVRNVLTNNSIVQMFLIMLALVIIFSIYHTFNKREKLMEAQKIKAEESSKAKSAFLSNMSHDIRTPMNAIIGYINLAKDEGLGIDEIKEYLDKIDSSSKHLLALINDILEMSRIESGKMELELVPTDLRIVMRDVRDMFSNQMSGKKITYTVDISGITDSIVMCDRNRFDRILLNLISNAYKFTPENGSVTVTLRQSGSDPEYELRVKDSGIGMAPEFAARVFEAFERERTSTVSGIQGTGLGMAITKSIIDLMGGTVRVETAPGKGTEFIVDIPFEKAEMPETEQSKSISSDDKPTVDFTEKRLLLVDDVEINREIAAKILRHVGFTVEAAVDGKDALDKVASSKPGYFDAVLMDIQMPVMDGYAATSAIRALDNESLAKIPIIAMTANAFSEDVQKAHDAGMNAHVAKPIDINALTSTLNEILQ